MAVLVLMHRVSSDHAPSLEFSNKAEISAQFASEAISTARTPVEGERHYAQSRVLL